MSDGFKLKSNTICSMPWSHLFMDPSGRLKPCCRFQDKYRPESFDLAKTKMPQAFQSDFLNDIRSQMLRGERVNGCQRCYEEEDSGKKSLRLRYNNRERYIQNINIEAPQIEWIEVSHSNICNLACRMCDYRYSSLWERHERSENSTFKKAISHDLINSGIDFSKLHHIKFTGGEPLLDPTHVEFISKLVHAGSASRMTINYSTNCTIAPSAKLIELWDQFEGVEVALSIDSIVPAELEYIRWPAKQPQVIQVAEEFFKLQNKANFTIGLRPSISYLNIRNIPQLYSWWREHTKSQWFNPTHITHPNWLSLTVLEKRTKKKISNEIELQIAAAQDDLLRSHLKSILLYMNLNDDSMHLNRAIEKLTHIDRVRNQDFYKTYGNLLDRS